MRSSFRVSGPKVLNMTSPPGRVTRENSPSAAGRSFTHCSARFDHTMSIDPEASGSRSRSPHTGRVRARPPSAERQRPGSFASAVRSIAGAMSSAIRCAFA